MKNELFEVKFTSSSDLPKLALCHKKSFRTALSSQMRIQYVVKMLSWYLFADKAFLFHIERGGQCIGYCGGMVADGSMKTGSASGMLQHSFKEAMIAIILRPWLLFHPELLKKWKLIIRNFAMKFKPMKMNISKTKNEEFIPYIGLVVIGVLPEFQGKGVSDVLLDEFDKRASEYKVNRLGLTVKIENLKAIRAYEKNGWIEGKREGNSLVMNKILK